MVTEARTIPGEVQSHNHWLLGGAIDRALPLSSTLLIADFFAEKFEGIGRKTDLTTEVGARHQLTPQAVISGALGRHFSGAGHSTVFLWWLIDAAGKKSVRYWASQKGTNGLGDQTSPVEKIRSVKIVRLVAPEKLLTFDVATPVNRKVAGDKVEW